jgi:hypothetical protein
MRLTAWLSGLVILSASPALARGVCPDSTVEKSGSAGDISWASSVRRISPDLVCTQQQITSSKLDGPVQVDWPAAGILTVQITGQFVSSFCCSEKVQLQKAPLTYGLSGTTVEALAHIEFGEPDDDYPDLIEPGAQVKRSSFQGRVWDGSKYIDLDVEFSAAASYPHFQQSLFQFIVTDQSSEPLVVEWDLLQRMNRIMRPYFAENPKESKQRQSTYVFFAKVHPSPAHGVVEVRTSGGKLLGRFAVDGFTNQE